MTIVHGLEAGQSLAVRELVATAAAADGVAALGGHVLEALPGGDFLLRTDGEGRLVAVAALSDHDPAELVVLPEARRQGLGRELLQQVLATSNGVWAHGNLPAARALAESAGLQPTRELLQMARPLNSLPSAPPLPDGVSVRTFVPGQDEEQFLGVNGRAFAWHPEQGRLDLAGLQAEMAQDWFDPAGFFLAVDSADRVLGFHWTKVHPADEVAPAIGEVYVIGVDPQSPIRGLGRPLTVTGLQHLAEQGLSTVILYVEGDNAPALKLYRGLDFDIARMDLVWGPTS